MEHKQQSKRSMLCLLRAGDDDRVRGSFRYHGAATGRWSGEGLQPQNLKRVTASNLDAAVAAVETGDYQHVKGLYPDPLAVVGDCSRAMISAAPGHTLIGADFSAIESRVLAWVAGEAWKLDSYRRFDATNDPADEPYCETACRIFRVPSGSYTKDSPERAVGKVCDLAFGYMGGINAWRKFEPDRFTDDEVKKFCSEWRASHPAIRKLWYAVDRAALVAVRERGRVVRCGSIAIKCAGGFLLLKLPSGRKISYPLPRAVGDAERQHVTFFDNAAGQFTECRGGQGAYGGLWTENVVSGIARDLLAEAMLRIEAAGYPIVLHVHDEIVAEVPIGFGSTRRVHPADDAQACLGLGAADRSEGLERAALLQIGGALVHARLTTELSTTTSNRGEQQCCSHQRTTRAATSKLRICRPRGSCASRT